jgi:phage host-nuclease inhibitor protein Gam
MSTKKKKTVTPHLVLATEEALIGAINRHAELALVLKEEDAAHETKVAALNTEHTDATQERRDELARLESSIHLYATTNRETLFPGEKKSKEYPNAIIGFRLGNHSVGTIIPKETQATIALRLDALEWGEPYVKWTPAMDKDALLRDRLVLTPAQLAQAGIKFEQAERFFIDPAASSAARVTREEVAA